MCALCPSRYCSLTWRCVGRDCLSNGGGPVTIQKMGQLDGVLLGHAKRHIPTGQIHHNPTAPPPQFSAWNRKRYYGWGHQVSSQTPETALCHVSQTIVLTGYADPRRSYGSTDLDIPFYRLLRSYKTIDPAPKTHLSLPMRAIQCAAKFYRGKNTPKW